MNEAEYEQVVHPAGTVISHRQFRYRYFPRPWHYHEEAELLLITEGRGKRFVGGSVEQFAPGDLVLIGSRLPHFYLSDDRYYGDDPALECASEALQFPLTLFPADMAGIGELSAVHRLMEESRRGVRFTVPPKVATVQRMMRHVGSLSGVRRISTLLRVLDILARNYPYRPLNSSDYRPSMPRRSADPVSAIHDHILNHFREEITIGALAARLGMNPSSMCRLFRRNTDRTIFEVLTRTRIEFASKLLANSSMTVSQIAFEAGFRTVSHFNHQFRAVTSMTPTAYRSMFSQGRE